MTLSTSHAADILATGNHGFSYAGALALIEHLEQDEEPDNEMELDCVALRCEFCEYESLQDWADDYWGGDIEATASALGLEVDMSGDEFEEDEDEIESAIRDYIESNGTLIEFSGGIIVSSF